MYALNNLCMATVKKKTNKQQQQIEIQVNAIKGRVTCKMKKKTRFQIKKQPCLSTQ